MHEFYHLDGMEHRLLGFDLFQAASLVIDCELGCIWSSSVVSCHPYLESSQKTSKSISTSEVSTQTLPFLPFDNSDSISSDTEVKTVDLSTDPQTLKRMIEDLVIVADASAHAYGKHEGPDITDLIDFSQDIEPTGHVDSQYGYCSFDSSNVAETPALCCVEDIFISDTSKPEVELPQHLQVLFLQTVESSELSQQAEDGLKQLYLTIKTPLPSLKQTLDCVMSYNTTLTPAILGQLNSLPGDRHSTAVLLKMILFRKCCLLVLYNHQTQHRRPQSVLFVRKTTHTDSVLIIVN